MNFFDVSSGDVGGFGVVGFCVSDFNVDRSEVVGLMWMF